MKDYFEISLKCRQKYRLKNRQKGKNMLPSVDQNFGMSPLRGNNRKILDLVQEEVFHHNILQEY